MVDSELDCLAFDQGLEFGGFFLRISYGAKWLGMQEGEEIRRGDSNTAKWGSHVRAPPLQFISASDRINNPSSDCSFMAAMVFLMPFRYKGDMLNNRLRGPKRGPRRSGLFLSTSILCW